VLEQASSRAGFPCHALIGYKICDICRQQLSSCASRPCIRAASGFNGFRHMIQDRSLRFSTVKNNGFCLGAVIIIVHLAYLPLPGAH